MITWGQSLPGDIPEPSGVQPGPEPFADLPPEP